MAVLRYGIASWLFGAVLLCLLQQAVQAAPMWLGDYNALLSIKNAVGSNDNGAFSTWVAGTDPCATPSWMYITCSLTSQSNPVSQDGITYAIVTSLSLVNLNIAAPFPVDGITSLTNLQSLRITGNRFAGDLTSVDFSRLTRLQTFDLSKNSLSGTLPKSMASLSYLTDINVAGNSLNGLAEELGALKNLQTLYLANNPLGGQGIPSWLNSTFTVLTDLDMSYCGLHGGIPDTLIGLPALRNLLLNNNQLGNGAVCRTPSAADLTLYPGHEGESWCINPNIGLLNTSLVTLDLSTNNWQGNIPPQLGILINLVSLSLSANQLAGSIPDELETMYQLKYLNLDSNYFTGSIPVSLTTLNRLASLHLQNNRLTGVIPNEIGNLRCLTDLQLQINLLSGQIPSTIADIGAQSGDTISSIQLQNNRLIGTIPDFSNLQNGVTLLDLSQNSLGAIDQNGSLNNTNPIGIPGTLGSLGTALTHLDLSQNVLSGSLPNELGNLQSLEFLDLSENLLSGALPATLANMRSLQTINLGGNAFNGQLPDFFDEMPALEDLFAPRNSFTGAVPVTIFQGQSIQSIDLRDNQLTGLPTDCNGSTVQQLDLSGNVLQGSLPTCLTTLGLTFLNLDYNRMSGTLPPELGNLTKLQILGLGYNQFTGEVPSTICNDLKNMKALDISNNRLTGNLTNSCLFDRITYPNLHVWVDNNTFTCSANSLCPASLIPNPFKNITLGVGLEINDPLLGPSSAPGASPTNSPPSNTILVAPPPANSPSSKSDAARIVAGAAGVVSVLTGFVALFM